MTPPLTLQKKINPLRLLIVPKALSALLLSFAKKEGILEVIKSLKDFSSGEFTQALSIRLGYKCEEPVKERMARTLLDFLSECGCVKKSEGGRYAFTPGSALAEPPSLDADEAGILDEYFRGEMDFFKACLDESAGFLRGRKAPFAFSPECEPLWDAFLGNCEFAAMRSVLLKLMALDDGRRTRVLDLCYGLGHGLAGIHGEYPQAALSALDYKGVYRSSAAQKVKGFDVDFIQKPWGGFGAALPIADSTFDAVHFTCADPYIPPIEREGVYKEIFRVLKNGGTLGVLSWCYPDEDSAGLIDPWRRRQILAHDFIESVCSGWHGFYGLKETKELLRRVGFIQKKTVLPIADELKAALWVMEKP